MSFQLHFPPHKSINLTLPQIVAYFHEWRNSQAISAHEVSRTVLHKT